MKGIIRKLALYLGCAVAASGIGCATTTGCAGNNCASAQVGRSCERGGPVRGSCGSNKDLYDRCYPERYNNLAKRAVNLAFTPQVQNAHVLDQTVWNHHFEPGTDKLNPGGQAHLQYLSRRRPQPDTTIYLATGLDLPYDSCCPDRYAGARAELDSLRYAALQKYLVALNAGRQCDFQIVVHDPADPSVSAIPASSTVTQMYGRFRGGLSGGGGGTAGASGGGTSGGTGR